MRFKRKENSARVLAARKKNGESAKNEARGRGKGGKGTLASNHCESQILRSPANGASDWFKIGQMIETRLLLTLAWLLIISRWRVTKKIYRKLSISWPRRVQSDREPKEEQECAILQLMRGGDLLGV